MSDRLSRYVNATNAFVFCKVVYSQRVGEWLDGQMRKYQFQKYYMSLGGPILLTLKGNPGAYQIPVKLPRQQAETSIYSCESMLNITLILRSEQQLSKSLPKFVQFILADIIQNIQYKDDNYTIYFQKLQMFNMDQNYNLIQFSRQQIISNSLLVQRELLRNIQKENMIIRAKCIYRLGKELSAVVGQEFVSVYKEYVLVVKELDKFVVLSNQPLKFAMREVFLDRQIIQIILQSEQLQQKDLFLQFKATMMHCLMHELNNQNIHNLVWHIFYYVLYQKLQSKQNKQFADELNKTLSYILLSPISFVHVLIHRLKCVRWLTLPSFPTINQNQAYLIIINLQTQITAFIQTGDYIYWELQVFYQAIKRLLSIVVEVKQLKKNAIVFIVDHALLMLEGVTVNFNQIMLVLQGNILSYLNLMKDNLLEKDNKPQDHVSYQNFIKGKELPTRVLKVNEEVKKHKKQLNLPEVAVKQIILGKYISQYNFYHKIYNFYWSLIIGKKVSYPLSLFLKQTMVNSTRTNYNYHMLNKPAVPFKIQSNTINQIVIYQINNPQTSYVFYGLAPDGLQPSALKQYKTILDLITPLIQAQNDSDNDLGFRYGSRNSIDSNSIKGKSLDKSLRNKTIISLKSVTSGLSVGQQISSFNQNLVLLDLIITRNFNNKLQLYSLVLDYLNNLMDRMDKQQFSVLGLSTRLQNSNYVINVEETVYSKILSDDGMLRYDYKKKLQLDRFIKFIDGSLGQGKLVEMTVVYTLREVVKVMKMGFNFYYKANSQQKSYTSVFKTSFVEERVFGSKRSLLQWCEVNQYTTIKELQGKNKSNSKQDMIGSLKRLHEQKQISIVEILSQKQVPTHNLIKPNPNRYYRQSPFFNTLQRSLQLIDNLLILIEYLKTDRRGRYEITHLNKIYTVLKYYLVDKCLMKDDYIYSEGVSVSIVNLLNYLREYIEQHPDNNGEERELLYLQRVVGRLGNLVKYAQICCAVCIHQSMNVEEEERSRSAE